MVRKVNGTEVGLDQELLRAIATTLTKLNALKDVSTAFAPAEEDDEVDTTVRVDVPDEFPVTRGADRVGTLRRRPDGTWVLMAVIAE